MKRKYKHGDRCNKLTFLHPVDSDRWMFRCDCGAEKTIRTGNVTRGETVSCGCHSAPHGGKAVKYRSEYTSLRAATVRCHDKESPQYESYGARGIQVCDRWRQSFLAFLEDMGPKPSRNFTLDRIDNSRGYEPENCRWADKVMQAENRRTTRWIAAFGERKPISGWVKDGRCVVSKTTLFRRINAGIDPEVAISSLDLTAQMPQKEET